MATKDITDAQAVQAAAGYWSDYHAGINPKPSIAERLMKETGQPMKVCWRAIERAIRNGYLEQGVSLRTSHVTENGVALLASITGIKR